MLEKHWLISRQAALLPSADSKQLKTKVTGTESLWDDLNQDPMQKQ
jgi:hypothetical protein